MAKPKKRKPPAQRLVWMLPGPLVEALAEVEEALDQGEWQRVHELLAALRDCAASGRGLAGMRREAAEIMAAHETWRVTEERWTRAPARSVARRLRRASTCA